MAGKSSSKKYTQNVQDLTRPWALVAPEDTDLTALCIADDDDVSPCSR